MPTAGQETARIDPLEPVPVSGCGVCVALATDREIFRDTGDLCSVAEQNAELRNHPHGRKGSMTPKAVLRYISYVMRRHPSAETTATARCLNPECDWASAPTGSADVCTDMCIQHTGRTGHMTYLREFSEVAVVERVP